MMPDCAQIYLKATTLSVLGTIRSCARAEFEPAMAVTTKPKENKKTFTGSPFNARNLIRYAGKTQLEQAVSVTAGVPKNKGTRAVTEINSRNDYFQYTITRHSITNTTLVNGLKLQQVGQTSDPRRAILFADRAKPVY